MHNFSIAKNTERKKKYSAYTCIENPRMLMKSMVHSMVVKLFCINAYVLCWDFYFLVEKKTSLKF